MKSLKTTGLTCVAAATLTTAGAASAALSTGDIAFTGFLADGEDGFAVVALTDIAAGEEVFFRDDEWDGTAFGTGEGEFIWTTSAIAAGSVVTFVTDAGTPTASTGSVSVDPAFGDGSIGISSSGETIFAFQGASNTPTTFLAAIGSDANGIENTIAGTGLTVGTTAIELVAGSITDGPDGGQYTGPRGNQTAFANYLTLVNDPANWTIVQGGSGDQSGEVLPFDTTAFVIPEPATAGLVGLGLIAVLGRRRSRA